MIQTIYKQLIMVLILTSGTMHVLIAQEKDNYYEATFEFNENIINISGKSSYIKFPLMYSFYLEKSESVSCGIHILYQEEKIKPGVYKIGTDHNPNTYVTCVRQDDEISERIVSESGEFKIDQITNESINGSYDIKLIGGITDIVYSLNGIFSSERMD